MSSWTKWVFGGLGWAMGGPIGGILGFTVGAVLQGATNPQNKSDQAGTQPGDFGAALLVLCAAVMKSDNRVLRSELEFAKEFFVKQFGMDKGRELILLLRDLLKRDLPVEDVCRQIRVYLDEPSRLQLIHLLFGLSAADGHVHPLEVELIGNIAMWMGIPRREFESIKAMFDRFSTSAFQVLEVNPEASNDEIKKAFRRLAVLHHPDKVENLGPDFRKAAEEKFKSINEAYNQIKKERNFN